MMQAVKTPHTELLSSHFRNEWQIIIILCKRNANHFLSFEYKSKIEFVIIFSGSWKMLVFQWKVYWKGEIWDHTSCLSNFRCIDLITFMIQSARVCLIDRFLDTKQLKVFTHMQDFKVKKKKKKPPSLYLERIFSNFML